MDEWIQEFKDKNDIFRSHVNKIKEIVESTREPCEGNCVWNNETTDELPEMFTKQVNLFHFAKEAENILEIGFNAGHSCLIFLLANDTSKIQLFDIGRTLYSKLCFNYLNEQFPGRLSICWGNSIDTIPKFYQQNPDTKFDLFHIDGCHYDTFVFMDIMNCRNMAKVKNVMFSDDDQMEQVYFINRKLTMEGYIRPVPALETFYCKHYVCSYNASPHP